MIREACELRAAAREALSGKWGGAVVVTLLYMLIMGAATGLSGLIQLLLLPLTWAFAVIFLDNLRSGGEYKVEALFDGFKDYGRIWGTTILMNLYICLWTLLLIVPGIIKSLSYALTPYILRDNPELKYNEAIEKSMVMMDGHKFDLFYLHLTFIGWWILACLSCGIGLLWLTPYIQSAVANFYEDVKVEYEGRVAA